jgi:hypothetical protein
MYKGDKQGDARFLCDRDHRDAFPLSGGLLIVDSYLKWSAANRRAGELPRLSEQDAGGVASVRAYGSYPCI